MTWMPITDGNWVATPHSISVYVGWGRIAAHLDTDTSDLIHPMPDFASGVKHDGLDLVPYGAGWIARDAGSDRERYGYGETQERAIEAVRL